MGFLLTCPWIPMCLGAQCLLLHYTDPSTQPSTITSSPPSTSLLLASILHRCCPCICWPLSTQSISTTNLTHSAPLSAASSEISAGIRIQCTCQLSLFSYSLLLIFQPGSPVRLSDPCRQAPYLTVGGAPGPRRVPGTEHTTNGCPHGEWVSCCSTSIKEQGGDVCLVEGAGSGREGR